MRLDDFNCRFYLLVGVEDVMIPAITISVSILVASLIIFIALEDVAQNLVEVFKSIKGGDSD